MIRMLHKIKYRGVAMVEYAVLLAFVAIVGVCFISENGIASNISAVFVKVDKLLAGEKDDPVAALIKKFNEVMTSSAMDHTWVDPASIVANRSLGKQIASSGTGSGKLDIQLEKEGILAANYVGDVKPSSYYQNLSEEEKAAFRTGCYLPSDSFMKSIMLSTDGSKNWGANTTTNAIQYMTYQQAGKPQTQVVASYRQVTVQTNAKGSVIGITDSLGNTYTDVSRGGGWIPYTK